MRCDVVEPGDDAAGTTGRSVGPGDGAWVLAARSGDPDAFGRLFDRWFDPVYDVAWRIVRDRDTAAELAQEVFLVAWQGLDRLERPESFGGWVRRIARNRALNRLDRERRSVPGDEQVAAALDRSAPEVDMTARLGERDQRELVWAAASALGERDASLLDLHLRHGLTAGDIADELGVTANNAYQLLHRLKGRLAGAVRAWVLWRDGGRSCAGLDGAITAAGLTTFGADAVRVIGRHVRGCDGCAERQQLRVAPEALFAAVPVVAAPAVVRLEAAEALAQAGVPVAGASTGAGSGTVSSGDGGGGAAGEGAWPGDGGGGGTGGGTGPSDHVTPAWRVPVIAGLAVLATALLALVALVSVGGTVGGGGDGEGATAASRPAASAPGGDEPPPAGTDPTGAPKPPPQPATTTAVDASAPDPGTTRTDGSPGDPAPPPPSPDEPPSEPAPTIGAFRATAGPACGPDQSGRTVSLVWASSNADSATIAGPGGVTSHPASGTATVCAPTPATFTLAVTGPGGSADATVTAS